MSSRELAIGVVRGAYPERVADKLSKLDELGDRATAPILRRRRARGARWPRLPALVAARAGELEAASEERLREVAGELGLELRRRGFAKDLIPGVFALVRESARRTIGQEHFDVQLLGGWALLQGAVAEMETGEGKTLTATLPACTAALAGIPVHVITVNDYLATRDAEWMGPIYRSLGLSVGVVVSGMAPAARQAAYACDVAYCTNKEIAFDYLKDRIALRGHPSRIRLQLERLVAPSRSSERLLHRGLHFAIVDEADSVLIDEARTPLIISDQRSGSTEVEVYREAVALAGELALDRDFEIDDRDRRVILLEEGAARLAELAKPRGGVWSGQRRREELVSRALAALWLYQRDQHYLVHEGRIRIVDEYTGRVMADRSWEQGLHQMIEVKEEVAVTGRRDTLARISYQGFFRRYLRLAGMTGTAREVAAELWSTYGLPVVRVPTNRRLRRSFVGERVLATADEKWAAIVERIAELHVQGRPVLIGTRSVSASEHLGELLDTAGIPHRMLNARQDREEAEIVAGAGGRGCITVATNMAGRGTDIRLAPGVEALGGLHVLASERHDARRIDRQLYGRCGRQGDAGSYEAIVSLEDEVCRVYGPALARRLAARAGRSLLGRWLSSLALDRAQRSAGRLHSRIRRDLLAMDSHLDSLLAFSGRPE